MKAILEDKSNILCSLRTIIMVLSFFNGIIIPYADFSKMEWHVAQKNVEIVGVCLKRERVVCCCCFPVAIEHFKYPKFCLDNPPTFSPPPRLSHAPTSKIFEYV